MTIKDDSPQDAAPATPKERQAILDKLSEHMTPDCVATLDGVSKKFYERCGLITQIHRLSQKNLLRFCMLS